MGFRLGTVGFLLFYLVDHVLYIIPWGIVEFCAEVVHSFMKLVLLVICHVSVFITLIQ